MKAGKRGSYEKPVRLDMLFDEALNRFAKTNLEEISLKANKIGILDRNSGSKEISQMQGDLSWALAVLGKRQRCVRMHEAGPYQRLKRTEPIAPVSTAAR